MALQELRNMHSSFKHGKHICGRFTAVDLHLEIFVSLCVSNIHALNRQEVTEFIRLLYDRQPYRKVIGCGTNQAFYSAEPQAQLLNLPLLCCNGREKPLANVTKHQMLDCL